MPPSPTEVICPECHTVIGEYREHEGKVCLVAGPLIIEDGWCWCRLCLTRFYWHSSEKKLDRLIERRENFISWLNRLTKSDSVI
jgi:hypothetical protein